MKIRVEPGIVINLVTSDPVRIERLKYFQRKYKSISIVFSEIPLSEKEFDAFVLPIEKLPLIIDCLHIKKGDAAPALLCYGRAKSLRNAFLSGCSDYLKEPWDAEELECRLLRLLSKNNDTFCFTWGKIMLNDMKLICPDGEGEIKLSHQEYKICQSLLKNRGQIVPREVLYYAIWGKPSDSSRVVDVHISSLRKKLESLLLESKGCISSVRGCGYVIS